MTLLLLCVSCHNRISYPPFPVPSAEVAKKMDVMAKEDSGVREWLNKLLDLCQQLGTCEKE
uniref:Uncharacterized protein n=1 Tax=viral metagenome TaxID=1070528 RepID=A0A6M3LNQ4_9ZZZZ